MPGKRHTPEEIRAKLREADALRAQGATAMQIAEELDVCLNTYQRWRQASRIGEPQPRADPETDRLEELEEENTRLKLLVVELSLDVQRLRESSPNGGAHLTGVGR